MNVWTQVNQAWVCAATISWRLGTQTQSPLCSIESAPVALGSGTPTIARSLYQIASDRVFKVNAGGATIESIDLAGRVPLPEGPGAAAVFQSIGWRDSLRLSAYVVDRWRGLANERLHRAEISVTGRDSVTIQGKPLETFRILIQPDGGAYRIVHQVTVRRPHQIVRTEYAAGSPPAFVSEAVALSHDAGCQAAPRGST